MKLAKQFVRFIGISGVGWILDFSLYTILTMCFNWEVFFSNCLSSIPAVTLVFFVSTKKIFENSEGKISVRGKYWIYLIYQALLLLEVSYVGQYLSQRITQILILTDIIPALSKIISKLLITPVTMILNFFVMKFLTEKI